MAAGQQGGVRGRHQGRGRRLLELAGLPRRETGRKTGRVPRFAKKGRDRDRDRVTFTTGAIRVEPDRRHVTLPRAGTVRVHENTRRLQRLLTKRLLTKGRARILAVTVSRQGTSQGRRRQAPSRL